MNINEFVKYGISGNYSYKQISQSRKIHGLLMVHGKVICEGPYGFDQHILRYNFATIQKTQAMRQGVELYDKQMRIWNNRSFFEYASSICWGIHEDSLTLFIGPLLVDWYALKRATCIGGHVLNGVLTELIWFDSVYILEELHTSHYYKA